MYVIMQGLIQDAHHDKKRQKNAVNYAMVND